MMSAFVAYSLDFETVLLQLEVVKSPTDKVVIDRVNLTVDSAIGVIGELKRTIDTGESLFFHCEKGTNVEIDRFLAPKMIENIHQVIDRIKFYTEIRSKTDKENNDQFVEPNKTINGVDKMDLDKRIKKIETIIKDAQELTKNATILLTYLQAYKEGKMDSRGIVMAEAFYSGCIHGSVVKIKQTMPNERMRESE